ncbi:MAG: BON domain-containing protein [Proteobacteria bacterium]|nr:BON domain-containing protein [Pseudomonadota bacterium]
MTTNARLGLRSMAVVAMAIVTAHCAGTPRSPAERDADHALAAQVERALSQDPQIYARHIEVDSERGVVHLSGYVWSAEELYEARRVAAQVAGVHSVVDELELMVGGRTGAR